MEHDESRRLEASYRQMSERELMDLAREYDSLTDEAQTALRAEFNRRSLEPPLIEEPADDHDAGPSLVTVRRYRDLSEAFVARAVLEGEGIPCFLQDENFVRLDWGYSNFIGGMRLQVSAKDAAFAEELLTQKAPAVMNIPGEPPFVQPICPKCGSDDIVAYDSGLKLAAASLLLVGLPTRVSARTSDADVWHCMHCGCNWSDGTDPQ
jgi:hypothetical protein